jgi:4-amino-4-deoxy-L-arabinose transferase-like glycosyltransferase
MGTERLAPIWFMLILVISLLLRLLPVYFNPGLPPSTDAIHEYDPIATSLLSGRGFVNDAGFPDCDRGPGYPLFLAAIYSCFTRDFLLVRSVQAIVDSATVIIAMLLAERLFATRKTTVVAGLLTACYPLLIYSSNLVAVETLFLFFFLLTIYLLVSAYRSENRLLYVLSGITLACSALIRSTTLLFPVVIGLWLLTVAGLNRKNITGYMLLLAAFVITISPWTIRNYLVFDEFMPTTINGGLNFYVGSSLKYLTTTDKRFAVTKADYRKIYGENISTVTTRSPKKRDAAYWQAARLNYSNSWNNNPLDVLKLTVLKAGRFWYATDSGRYEKLNLVIQVPFAVLAFLGLLFALKRGDYPQEIWLLVMSILYFWGIFVVMFPLARYTVPILPILALFVALLFNTLPTTLTNCIRFRRISS